MLTAVAPKNNGFPPIPPGKDGGPACDCLPMALRAVTVRQRPSRVRPDLAQRRAIHKNGGGTPRFRSVRVSIQALFGGECHRTRHELTGLTSE